MGLSLLKKNTEKLLLYYYCCFVTSLANSMHAMGVPLEWRRLRIDAQSRSTWEEQWMLHSLPMLLLQVRKGSQVACCLSSVYGEKVTMASLTFLLKYQLDITQAAAATAESSYNHCSVKG